MLHLFVIILVIHSTQCQQKNTTTIVSPSENETTTDITLPENQTIAAITTIQPETTTESHKGIYGGYYRLEDDNSTYHYIHGELKRVYRNYYISLDYFRDDTDDLSTLDYYFGYGISQVVSFKHEYSTYHNYYHNISRMISEKEWLPSDQVDVCVPRARLLCPENAEVLCLTNGTIYCVSRQSATAPCPDWVDNNATYCVNTSVPCVLKCLSVQVEELVLPCISTLVIVDIYANELGKTLNWVGKTYVESDALSEEERTYCVTVIFDPKLL